MVGNKLRVGIRPTNAFLPGPRGPQVEREKFDCEQCGQGFELTPWRVRQLGGAEPRFCSRKCFSASACFKADQSVLWVGGRTTYWGASWKKVRPAVVAEQDGKCAACNTHIGPSLDVHHRIPIRHFTKPADAHFRENLVGLCREHHALEDREIERLIRDGLDPLSEPGRETLLAPGFRSPVLRALLPGLPS